MATAVDFEERNDYIGKPPTMSDNQCYALPVARILTHIPGQNTNEKTELMHAHVSCWELNEEERAEVARTGKVYLKVLSTSTYPVSVHGTKPIYPGSGTVSDVLFTEAEVNEMRR